MISFFRFFCPKNSFYLTTQKNIFVLLCLFLSFGVSLHLFFFLLVAYLIVAFLHRRTPPDALLIRLGEVDLSLLRAFEFKHQFWQGAGVYLPVRAEVEKIQKTDTPFTNKFMNYTLTLRDIDSDERIIMKLSIRRFIIAGRIYVKVGDRGRAGAAIGYIIGNYDYKLEWPEASMKMIEEK